VCIGDLDLPAGELELVVDEAGTVHRLDRRPHPPERPQSPSQ
jgi:hypothetical protein